MPKRLQKWSLLPGNGIHENKREPVRSIHVSKDWICARFCFLDFFRKLWWVEQRIINWCQSRHFLTSYKLRGGRIKAYKASLGSYILETDWRRKVPRRDYITHASQSGPKSYQRIGKTSEDWRRDPETRSFEIKYIMKENIWTSIHTVQRVPQVGKAS